MRTVNDVNERIRRCAVTLEPWEPIDCMSCGYESTESLKDTISIVDDGFREGPKDLRWTCPKCSEEFYAGTVNHEIARKLRGQNVSYSMPQKSAAYWMVVKAPEQLAEKLQPKGSIAQRPDETDEAFKTRILDSFVTKSATIKFEKPNGKYTHIVPKEITDAMFKDLPVAHTAWDEDGQLVCLFHQNGEDCPYCGELKAPDDPSASSE